MIKTTVALGSKRHEVVAWYTYTDGEVDVHTIELKGFNIREVIEPEDLAELCEEIEAIEQSKLDGSNVKFVNFR